MGAGAAGPSKAITSFLPTAAASARSVPSVIPSCNSTVICSK
jgi:hypothetical protein